MPRIAAWACGLRTNAASSMSGKARSATKRPLPMSSGGSSSRLTERPMELLSLTPCIAEVETLQTWEVPIVDSSRSQSPSLDADLGVVDDLFVFRHLVADVVGEPLPARSDR